MKRPRLWERCVDHRGPRTAEFFAHYFANTTRRCRLIAGAGFDPRSLMGAQALVPHLGDRLSALFIREERRGVAAALVTAADRHVDALKREIPNSTTERIDILAHDNAVIGGRNAVELMRKQVFSEVTDVVIDLSALSIGTSFPIVRYVLDVARQSKVPLNVHAIVVSMATEDESRRRVSNEAVSVVHGFDHALRLHGRGERATLWIPQLSVPKVDALKKIHAWRPFDDVCPILPFPSKDPRAADRIAEQFLEQLERTWAVDARNIVYAAEDDPLDVYRTILDIEEQRRAVFDDRSQVVLSPVGSKAVALGSLMAAIDRDLPVVYVEALKYDARPRENPVERRAELLHVWLHGEAYPTSPEGPTP